MARTGTGPPLVRFYQLAASPFETVLVRIANKAWERGLRVCLRAADASHAHHLNDLLWRQPADGFLPHGLWNGGHVERQPLLIAPGVDDRNGASVIILGVAEPLAQPDRFDMVVDFVPGGDPLARAASRDRYRHYRQLGCTLEYWIQAPEGGWSRKT